MANDDTDAGCALCELGKAIGWGLLAGTIAGVLYMAADLILDGKLTQAWTPRGGMATVTELRDIGDQPA